jgi:pimeloyl-ACP methyl ester carboxylesterase
MTNITRVASTLVLVLTAAAAASPGASAPVGLFAHAAPCKPAVIGGKHACLKSGQRCASKLDRQYHRYGFHCHAGKLARRPPRGAPSPSSPPASPPAEPRRPAPPGPGQRVDIGGYSLYIECTGTGTPTVIMEQGWALPGATGDPTIAMPGWVAVRTSLATDTRVCAYDRAGLGASDSRPSSAAPPAATLTKELRTMLASANLPAPYVLIGASFGGLLSIAHMIQNPSDFVGLVLVDALRPCLCAFPLPDPARFDASIADTPLGNVPLVVLTSGLESFLSAELGKGPELARRSTNSIWANAPGSSHAIANDRTQLVVDAARLVVAAVRGGTRLPVCDATNLPSDGGTCGKLAAS